MNYLRAGGLLCLLLVAVAAVLPMGAFAQGDAPGEAAPPGTEPSMESAVEDETAEDGAAEMEAPPEDAPPADAPREDLSPSEDSGVTDAEPAPTEEESPAEVTTSEEGGVTAEPTPTEETEMPPAEEAAGEAPMMDAPMQDAPRDDSAPIREAIAAAVSGEEMAGEENDTEVDDGNATDEDEELSTTDRIWREGKNPNPYTWDYQTYSGFFYDLDDDVGTETLTVELGESGDGYDREIDEGELTYETEAVSIEFEFDDWGNYHVIGFMAQKYFAGYIETNEDVVDEEISLLDEEELREVLIDDDEEYTVDTGSVLPLEDGYEARIKEIDLDGNKVWFSLAKDGEEVDDQVIDPRDLGSSTYKYEIDMSGKDMPLVMIHVSSIFAGAETSLVTVDGIFQISDQYITVESDSDYGDMTVDTISGDTIRMSNDNSITLRKGRTVPVMGEVSFLVGDSDELRFGPTVERTGSYEIRGTVIDPGEYDEFTWTPYNFEGFYYDIDDDVGTETMTATFSGDSIDDGDLEYSTEPELVRFEFDDWGQYQVIGFLAEKYFAGYSDDTEFTDEFSVINEEELRKVLIDDDESYTIRSGASFPLKEGYELRIKEVDLEGNRVYMSVVKDGDEVDSKVVEPGSDVDSSTFTYEVEIGSEDVPIIAVNVESVFRGREEDLATIEGIFQVSDDPRSVEENEAYGKMEIDSVSSDGIEMRNDGSFSLGRGRTISIMENMYFRTSDSDERLVAPIVQISAELLPMMVDISETTVGTPAEIVVTSDGAPVVGALITLNGEEVGTTDTDGVYTYSSNAPGSFEVEVSKDEYTDVQTVLVVSEIREERVLAVSSPQEVMKGESFVIKATIGLEQRPVEDADIAFDGISIGTTDEIGTVSFASDSVGSHTITASKEGYENGSRSILVTTPIEITGLEVDETARAGRRIEITATAVNDGQVSDNATVELRVNGNPEGSMDIALEPGETGSLTFEYTPEEPGIYTVEVDGIQRTVTVEERSSTRMVVGILILLAVIGAGAYLYSTGKLKEILEQIKNR